MEIHNVRLGLCLYYLKNTKIFYTKKHFCKVSKKIRYFINLCHKFSLFCTFFQNTMKYHNIANSSIIHEEQRQKLGAAQEEPPLRNINRLVLLFILLRELAGHGISHRRCHEQRSTSTDNHTKNHREDEATDAVAAQEEHNQQHEQGGD